MIQRIQTLFLLAASALTFSLFFSVMANVTPVLIMIIVSFSVSFVSIFMYRKRVLQIRLNVFNTVILIALQGWILWLYLSAQGSTYLTTTVVFPAVSAILSMMAIKYIARDEAMVRSTSRLRDSKKSR